MQTSDSAPTVSVVIPAYNPWYLKAALDSALIQTYTPLEILISDDCSTGEIKAVVDEVAPSDERVKYVKNEQQLGRYGNYQRCFELATGEYVKYLNDDDLLHPECVALMARCLQRYPDVTLVTSHRQLIDEEGKFLADDLATQRVASDDSIIDGLSVCDTMLSRRLNFVGEPTTTLFRKRDLQDVHPTINSIAGIQVEHINDIAMWLNLLSKGDLIYLVKTLSYFRLHGEQGQAEPDADQRARVHWRNILEHGLRLGYWHPERPAGMKMKMRPLDIRPQWSDDILPQVKLAHKHLSQGDYEAAMQALGTAMIMAPDDPWLAMIPGNVLLQSGDVENARQKYLKVTQLQPDFSPGYVKLGEVALQLGRLDEAEKALTKALVLQPENMDARKFLGRIYLDTKRVKEGIQAFTAVVKQQPYDIDSLLALGTCSIELGVHDSARDLFEWVLKIDPQNKLARENLAVVNSRESVSPESGSISG